MHRATIRLTNTIGHLNALNDTKNLSFHNTAYTKSSNTEIISPNQYKFYIDGNWVSPVHRKLMPVISPITEKPIGEISIGSKEDVDIAVNAANRAFQTFSQTTKEERIQILKNILIAYQKRYDEIAKTITLEMGCPIGLSTSAQAAIGIAHIKTAIEELQKFQFEEEYDNNLVVKAPIGVVGMITPWNWPINQIACKVIPAICCGCTMVLKPSELSPFNAIIWAEILHEAGVPNGVFNLIQGTGDEVGQAISSHLGINAVTFTGSTRAGIAVAKAAADTVKRVSQELGGKSPHIILNDIPESELESVITYSVRNVVCSNSGQSCNAPTRLLVPAQMQERIAEISKRVVESIKVGNPLEPDSLVGPVVSLNQWNKIQDLIKSGIKEGAHLVVGGLGRPYNLPKGYYVKPTIFSNVKNNMRIAQEEIFGPVLCIIPYQDEEEAIKIANDTPYGLSSEISGRDYSKMQKIASRIQAGAVKFNNAPFLPTLPFGGFKQSGNGREWGKWAFGEFLEIKTLIGYKKK